MLTSLNVQVARFWRFTVVFVTLVVALFLYKYSNASLPYLQTRVSSGESSNGISSGSQQEPNVSVTIHVGESNANNCTTERQHKPHIWESKMNPTQSQLESIAPVRVYLRGSTGGMSSESQQEPNVPLRLHHMESSNGTSTESQRGSNVAIRPHVGSDNTEVQQEHSGKGYMFALGYHDQGTGSFVNLMSFRCFASLIKDVNIVEPFMAGSILGLNVSMRNWTEELTFSNIFDRKAAEKFARNKHFSKLVPFGEFLKDAPRKLLVAQHKCVPSPDPCLIPCGHPEALERGKIFARRYGFEVVGQICLNYDIIKANSTVTDIVKQLYKEYSKSEVTVMFIRYGGVQRGTPDPEQVHRFYLSVPDACYRNYAKTLPVIRPSPTVLKRAAYYVRTYLRSKKYISELKRFLEQRDKKQNRPK